MSTMIVGMSFGVPRQTRKLESEARSIEQSAGAESGVVSNPSAYYFRRKMGSKKVDGLHALKTFNNEWKMTLRSRARYPFSQGVNILPSGLVAEFNSINVGYRSQQQAIIDKWIAEEYPQWLASAPERMGSLYDPNDFPSAQDCRDRFIAEVTVLPLADAEQWNRIALISPDLAATMQQQQNETVERVTREAHARMWNDVMRPLNNIVTQLSKDKTKIYESLVGNAIEIANLVPAYNDLHRDPQLTAIANEIKEALAGITIEDLRKSPEVKEQALAATQAIITKFDPYARAFDLGDDEDEEPTQQQPE